MNKYLIFSSIGFELIGIMLGSVYLGEAIDKSYNTKGLALVALVFIGLASWLTHVILLLRKFQKDDSDEETKE